MTQVGEGPEADGRPVMTFGAPAVGEILADRYRLEEHINDDSAGRQVWRGADVILRRPVAVVLRYPGGDQATEMLAAAVAASRVAHANLVGVYDAIDEGQRAYVVREWVDGAALRDYVAHGPLPASRATTVGHAVASAVAAIHATGMVHGNIHPGTVLIASEGRVVLADARADSGDTPEGDVRAVGGNLYFALTGHWPHAEVPGGGGARLPDGRRDANGALPSPRQIRAGVPTYLDELVMDLLDPGAVPPSAEVLAAELGRLDHEAEVEASMDGAYYDTESPLGFGAVPVAEPARPAGRKVAVGVVALLLVAVAGMLLATKLLAPAEADGDPGTPGGTGGTTSTDTPAPQGNGEIIAIRPDQVRVVDPGGNRSEVDGIDKAVDGKPDTGWNTEKYNGNPKFGGIKPGMGILINLGEARKVSVALTLSNPGASVDLRVGSSDPGATKPGDGQVLASYKVVQEYSAHNGTNMVFNLEEPAQYLLIWITEMPQVEAGPPARFQIGVQEIVVHARG